MVVWCCKHNPAEEWFVTFERASEEETIALIIADLTKAHEYLPTSKWRGYGTWTRYTVALLQKALLFRASERNDGWNTTYATNDPD